MNKTLEVFSGRIVFDHLPKTGGQAVNAWLSDVLGSGTITTNLIGNHENLVRTYGGNYPIISGHLFFDYGTGLDPRYRYITMLREPVERIISWLYFIVNNHTAEQLPDLYPEVKSFLESDGSLGAPSFLDSISNFYVRHFHSISGVPSDDAEQQVTCALTSIANYTIVGMFDDMAGFTRSVSEMLEIPQIRELSPQNVTNDRPSLSTISEVLKKRIRQLNELDMHFFETVRKREAKGMPRHSTARGSSNVPRWHKFEKKSNRVIGSEKLRILSGAIRGDTHFLKGSLATFDLYIAVTTAISDLEIGIHIFDRDRRWAFGVNSTLLKRSFSCPRPGKYKVTYMCLLDLPTGGYTAGFAFSSKDDISFKQLAWQEAMLEFDVIDTRQQQFVGHSYLPAQIMLAQQFDA